MPPTTFRELRLEEVVVRKHIHTACLFLLALVASGAVLVHLRAVLVPFVLAMGLFYSLLPIVDLLSAQPSARRSHSPRGCLNPQVRENDPSAATRTPNPTPETLTSKPYTRCADTNTVSAATTRTTTRGATVHILKSALYSEFLYQVH